jgi:hypothetical protein
MKTLTKEQTAIQKGILILRAFVISLLFSFAGSASASDPEFVMPHWEAAAEAPAMLSADTIHRAIRATALIDEHKYCTGVFLSREGHLVTALHCLKQDLNFEETDKLFKLVQIPEDSPEMEGRSVSAFVVTTRSTDTRLHLAFAMPGESRKGRMVKVLALGKGWPANFPNAKTKEETLFKLRELTDDWAIVKFDQLPPGHDCLRASTEIKAKGEFVWHTGSAAGVESPARARERKYRENMMREEEYRSAEKGWEDAWYRQDRSAFDEIFPFYISGGYLFGSYLEMLRARPGLGTITYGDKMSGEQYLASSAASMSGFSGGAALNRDGELVGINAMKVLDGDRPGEKKAITGEKKSYPFSLGTSVLSIGHIRSQVGRILGDEKTEKIFHCP